LSHALNCSSTWTSAGSRAGQERRFRAERCRAEKWLPGGRFL